IVTSTSHRVQEGVMRLCHIAGPGSSALPPRGSGEASMTAKSVIAASTLAWALSAQAGYAQVKVLAVAQIPGNQHDLNTQTSANLENGVSGNLLGGFGSGITYAGGTTFLAVPDRG